MSSKPFTFVLFLLLVPATNLSAQYDSAYYSSYPRRVTGRIYFSNKYTIFKFQNSKENYNLKYQPNTSVNAGVGATYRNATLNLGIGVLNRNPAKGKTRYLDLQYHNYGRKFTLDVLGQFYSGFYLFPKGTGSGTEDFYKRPDLRVNEVGTSLQYVWNHRHFSYRASFIQNEWQKKSAGSFLIGFETYVGKIRADSSIVPRLVSREAAAENLRIIRFFELGPNFGYAYTWVYKRSYFLTGSGSVSLDYGTYVVESNSGREVTSGFSPNTTFRFCSGYNSATWSLIFMYVNNRVSLASHHDVRQVALNTGNFRIIFARRFLPEKLKAEGRKLRAKINKA